MAANLAKAAAVGAAALSGGAGNAGNLNPAADNRIYPDCPMPQLAHYHHEDICANNYKPHRPSLGDHERKATYERLKAAGLGATLIPNEETKICPLHVESLENPTAVEGLDTTWLVENKSTKPVVIAWVVDGVEWSPFKPGVKPMDDPLAKVRVDDWLSIPTFESRVYHVREIDEHGNPGDIILQHRVGLIPVGNPNQIDCDASLPDVEPLNPKTAERIPEFSPTPIPDAWRPCNTIDLSFRNQVGCPLHVYWANRLEAADVPSEGFTCAEKFKFHLGTKPMSQDFMLDWESSTKFEGSYVGHTFVARLASNPNIVIDSFTVEPTKIIDCPKLKEQKVAAKSSNEEEAVAEVQADGTILNEGTVEASLGMQAASAAGMDSST